MIFVDQFIFAMADAMYLYWSRLTPSTQTSRKPQRQQHVNFVLESEVFIVTVTDALQRFEYFDPQLEFVSPI